MENHFACVSIIKRVNILKITKTKIKSLVCFLMAYQHLMSLLMSRFNLLGWFGNMFLPYKCVAAICFYIYCCYF